MAMSGKYYNEETLTTTTLAATTWTQVSAAVDVSSISMRELWNESGAEVWFVFQSATPTDTDDGRSLADAGAYITNKSTGLSYAALWVYSTAGGKVKYVEA